MNKDTYVHELKVWPKFFTAIKRGDKTFEIRKEDRERKFAEGDILQLREFEPCKTCDGTGIDRDGPWQIECQCKNTDSPKGKYTDSETIEYLVSYIMRGPQFGLQEGWVIMALQPIFEEGDLK